MKLKKFFAAALLGGTLTIGTFASANTDIMSLNPFGALLGGAAAYVPGTGIQFLDEAAWFELGVTLPKGLPNKGFASIHLVWSDTASRSCEVVFTVSGSLSRNGAMSPLDSATWVPSGSTTTSSTVVTFDSPIGFQRFDAILIRLDRVALHPLDSCSVVDVHGVALGFTTPAPQSRLEFFPIPIDPFVEGTP